jgi:4-amino-4-deoxy-L-arabinose transferase-like glycosyltransferase
MRVITIFLPFLAMLFLWRRRLDGWRSSFLTAAVLSGGWLAFMTELGSAFNRITPNCLAIGWIVGLAAVIAATRWIPQMPSLIPPVPADPRLVTWTLIPQVLMIVMLTGWVAWAGPPNNWDALSYHLPRVIHWIQDRNVAFFPVYSDLRQVEMAPGAEFIILHLQVLLGNDHLTDMVQWFAYCGCIIGVYSLAELLGAGLFGRGLASVAVATLPIACLEAESAQNDLVLAFWMLCVAWLVVRLCKMATVATPAAIWFESAVCGIALGLAFLTKTTAYVFAVPFLLALTVIFVWKLKLRALAPLAMLALIALAINAPTYYRNLKFSHTLLGTGGLGARGAAFYENAHIGLGPTVSNFLRNSGLELASPPSRFSADVESGIRRIHRWFKLDPDSPDTTMFGTQFLLTNTIWNSEDSAPNPIHFALAIFAGFILVVKLRRDPASRLPAIFGLGVFFAYLSFCAYLRWQPWHNRLHLPLMILSCAVIGVGLERHVNGHLIALVFGLMSMIALAVVVNGYNHPLVGDLAIYKWPREARFFGTRPRMQAPYENVVAIAQQNHCKQIGLIINFDDWEYPLDMMLRERIPGVRIESYPDAGPGMISDPKTLHTGNLGWNENLRPYAVVKVAGETASVVKIVP